MANTRNGTREEALEHPAGLPDKDTTPRKRKAGNDEHQASPTKKVKASGRKKMGRRRSANGTFLPAAGDDEDEPPTVARGEESETTGDEEEVVPRARYYETRSLESTREDKESEFARKQMAEVRRSYSQFTTGNPPRFLVDTDFKTELEARCVVVKTTQDHYFRRMSAPAVPENIPAERLSASPRAALDTTRSHRLRRFAPSPSAPNAETTGALSEGMYEGSALGTSQFASIASGADLRRGVVSRDQMPGTDVWYQMFGRAVVVSDRRLLSRMKMEQQDELDLIRQKQMVSRLTRLDKWMTSAVQRENAVKDVEQRLVELEKVPKGLNTPWMEKRRAMRHAHTSKILKKCKEHDKALSLEAAELGCRRDSAGGHVLPIEFDLMEGFLVGDAILSKQKAALLKFNIDSAVFAVNKAKEDAHARNIAASDNARLRKPKTRVDIACANIASLPKLEDIKLRNEQLIAASKMRQDYAKAQLEALPYDLSWDSPEANQEAEEKARQKKLQDEVRDLEAELSMYTRELRQAEEESRLEDAKAEEYMNRDRWACFPGDVRMEVYDYLDLYSAMPGGQHMTGFRLVSKTWERETMAYHWNTVPAEIDMDFKPPNSTKLARRIQQRGGSAFKALAFQDKVVVKQLYSAKPYQLCQMVDIFLRPSFLDRLVDAPRTPMFAQTKDGRYFPRLDISGITYQSERSLRVAPAGAPPGYQHIHDRRSEFISMFKGIAMSDPTMPTTYALQNRSSEHNEAKETLADTMQYDIELRQIDKLLLAHRPSLVRFFRGLQDLSMQLRKTGKTSEEDVKQAVLTYLEGDGDPYYVHDAEVFVDLVIKKGGVTSFRMELEREGLA